jgi:hypothetical protein
VLNKQSRRTADKGWPFNLVVGRVVNKHAVKSVFYEVLHKATDLDGLLEQPKV